MARIRTIKPDFFRHDGLYQAESETGLPLRLAFAGLWTACDREGRFEWKPVQLKLDCLPFDDLDFSRVLDALATRGYIVRYEVGGDKFGHIPTWRKHQVINNRESASKFPDPSKIIDLPTRAPRVPDACPTRHGLAQGEVEGEREVETTHATVTRTTEPDQPAAGVVPENSTPPPPPEVVAHVDQLRVTAGQGTDLHAKVGELHGICAANSVRCSASHPLLVDWARDGVTPANLTRAITEARKSNAGQLNPAYLDPILERVRNGTIDPIKPPPAPISSAHSTAKAAQAIEEIRKAAAAAAPMPEHLRAGFVRKQTGSG